MTLAAGKVLFENAKILTNNAKDDFFIGTVEIEHGKIKSVKPSSEKTDYSDFQEIHDLGGKILAPGFVQTHVHLCQTLFRNLADDLDLIDWLEKKIWPFEALHNELSLRASAELGIVELLSCGTTTILDMGTVKNTDAIFHAARDLGIRAFIGKCMMDSENDPSGLSETTQKSLDETLRLARDWHGAENGRLSYALAPRFALSCSATLLTEAKKIAHENHLLLHTHASENPREVELVRSRFGCDNIEYFEKLGLLAPNLIMAHCVWVSPHEAELIQKSGAKIAHCPSSNLKLGSGIAGIPEFLSQGISVGIGADGAPCNNNLSIFQEMRLASLLPKPRLGPRAMSAKEVYRLATMGGAEVLGISAEIGSIEAGKRADFIVLNLDLPHSSILSFDPSLEETLAAIVYSGSPQNIEQTWVDGKLCYHSGLVGDRSLDEFVLEARKQAGRFAHVIR
jgi:5-methylthioadenosine/S-adenosylhomocysteine deaminase